MAGFRFVQISGTVGRGGGNAHPDVVAVQELLNAHMPGAVHPLSVDGDCGPLTIAAIERAETVFIRALKPDGRLDPHGPTLHALNFTRKATSATATVKPLQPGASVPGGAATRPPGPTQGSRPVTAPAAQAPAPAAAAPSPTAPHAQPAPTSGDMVGKAYGEITPAAGAAAQDTQRTWKVPASVTLAQYMIESGAGHRMPRGSNNPFGIKAGRGQPSVMAWTYEYLKDGTRIHILAPFRVFGNIAEAFDAHGRLLAHHPAYVEARRHFDDADAFARGLEGHYSTTKGYGQTLVDQMKAHDLYRYNVKP